MHKNDIFTSLVSIGQISGKFAAVVLFVANNISSNSKSVSIFFLQLENYFKDKTFGCFPYKFLSSTVIRQQPYVTKMERDKQSFFSCDTPLQGLYQWGYQIPNIT